MLAALLVVPVSGLAAKQNEAKNNMGTIVPGAVWNDTGGNPINAHGAACYTTTAATTGTENTNRERPSCLNGQHGSATAPT